MRQSRFPPGWDEKRVARVLEHYENQTEDEAMWEDSTQTVMAVPYDLVPAVRELIAKRQKAS